MTITMSPEAARRELERWERETGASAQTALLVGPSPTLPLPQWAKGVSLWESVLEAQEGGFITASRGVS